MPKAKEHEYGNGNGNEIKERFIYYYNDTLSFGDIYLGSEQDPAYLFIELKAGTDNMNSTYFATGVFKKIPKFLKFRLPNNTDFVVNVKILKKGGSFGIYRELIGNFTMIDGSAASDSLSYQQPFPVRADAGACSVYTKSDSSEHTFEHYPQLDTYFGQLVFNTGKVNDTLKVNLDRLVWGLKCYIHNFKKGTIKLVVGDIQSPINPVGTSEQVINYPDSIKLFIHSQVFFPVYPHIEDPPRLRVIYNNTVQDQTIYDAGTPVNTLRKTILDIDLGKLNNSPVKILPDSILTEQEINKIN